MRKEYWPRICFEFLSISGLLWNIMELSSHLSTKLMESKWSTMVSRISNRCSRFRFRRSSFSSNLAYSLFYSHSIGKPVTLPPEAEEVASFFAAILETDYVKNPVFVKNFFSSFLEVLKEYPPVRDIFSAIVLSAIIDD